MIDNSELNMGGLLQIDQYGPAESPEESTSSSRPQSKKHGMNNKKSQVGTRPRKEPAPAAFDAWCLLEMLLQRWRLILVTGCLLAALGFCATYFLIKKSYMAVAQLIRYEPTMTGEFFKPPVLTPDTFASILKSPELLQIVSTNAKPPVSPEVLNKIVFVKTEVDSDMVKVAVKGRNPQAAVELANLYARQSVAYTLMLQTREAEQANRNYYSRQLGQMSNDIASLHIQITSLPNSGPMVRKLNQMSGTVSNLSQQVQTSTGISPATLRLMDKLNSAREDLMSLSKIYTEANPKMQQQKAYVESLQTQVSSSTTNAALDGLGMALSGQTGPMLNPEYDFIRAKLTAIENSREQLAARQREAEVFAANPPGNVRLYSFATAKNITPDKRWLKIVLATIFAGIFGMGFATGGVLVVELMDDRLKTAADVNRVTKLPVIATLDDLRNKGPSARESWGFRTWTMLQGRLSPSPNHGLVCGITSSKEGEGRSTWVHLLAEAASMSGFRVLTIATRPSGPNSEAEKPGRVPKTEKAKADKWADKHNSNGHANGDGQAKHDESNGMAVDGASTALTSSALTSPADVTDQLTGPNPQPMVHIPLPGWVWNLERRKQWQEAIGQWRQIDNLVILVELPPASQSEAILLGGNLPNLVWLTDSGVADAAETRTQLETLRNARCNLIGAVLNHEPAPPLKSRFPRWLGCLVIFLGLSRFTAQAAETNDSSVALPPVSVPANQESDMTVTNATFSLINSANRGDWQKRLTLGPGDTLNFSLYGQAELARADVFVGPDGRISFLEAQNVMAAGLTVDELRTNMDNELSKFRRAPRTIITPVAYHSKKYYMLGKIVQRGVYTLDRPLTIVEAVARAHGLETGLSDRSSLDLADFQRSFLMRKGKRIPINFEKLFEQGDLSQNVAIEPDDYLFFPSAALKEVYVLGEVRIPGIVPYTSDMTVVGAISSRGGFSDRAFKSHVVVIRGSINNPQPFVVDTKAILDARGQDFKVEPKDIIYVSSRPFIRAEELLDLAATAFVQSVATEWPGRSIGPIIGNSVIPHL